MAEPREIILKAAEELALKGKRATTANISDATQLKTQVISAHIRRLREKGQWRFNGLGEPVVAKSQSPYVKRMIENGESKEEEPASNKYVARMDPAGFSIMEDDEEVNELQFITRTLNDLDTLSQSARLRVWAYLTDRAMEEYPELDPEGTSPAKPDDPDKA